MSQGIAATSSVLVARFLGKELFGSYGLLQSTVLLFAMFSSLGLGAAVSRYTAAMRYTDQARLARIWSLALLLCAGTGVLLAIGTTALAPYITRTPLASPDLVVQLRQWAPCVALIPLSGVLTGALIGLEEFRTVAVVSAMTSGLTAAGTIIGAAIGGIDGAIHGNVFGVTTGTGVAFIGVWSVGRRRGIHLGLDGAWGELTTIWRFALPAFLAALVLVPTNWGGLALLAHAPNGMAEIAVFTASSHWQRLILFIPNSVGAVSLPLLTTLHFAGNIHRYRQVLVTMMKLNCVLALAVALPLAAMSPVVLSAYGTSYPDHWLVLVVLCVVGALQAVNAVVGQAVMSSGRMWYGMLFNVCWAVVYLGGAMVLVPRYGAVGLAAAGVLAYSLHTVWQFVFVLRWGTTVHEPVATEQRVCALET